MKKKREYTDTERMDWLARFVCLSGDTRVTASDGLPAASWWEWDRTDDGALRSAIDAAMQQEVSNVA